MCAGPRVYRWQCAYRVAFFHHDHQRHHHRTTQLALFTARHKRHPDRLRCVRCRFLLPQIGNTQQRGTQSQNRVRYRCGVGFCSLFGGLKVKQKLSPTSKCAVCQRGQRKVKSGETRKLVLVRFKGGWIDSVQAATSVCLNVCTCVCVCAFLSIF